MSTPGQPTELTLFGRSSSHFTRVTRLFAAELGVAPRFVVVPSLLSCDAADYGGHPALRLPVLHSPEGAWYGAANICRVLARHASAPPRIVWPEDLRTPLLVNAQELTLLAMSTEVSLIMATLSGAAAGDAHLDKPRRSLTGTLEWLDGNVDAVLAALPPERALSFLEVTLFCLVTHLEFREVVPIAQYRNLGAFRERFGEREAAKLTAYRFDDG